MKTIYLLIFKVKEIIYNFAKLKQLITFPINRKWLNTKIFRYNFPLQAILFAGGRTSNGIGEYFLLTQFSLIYIIVLF